MKAEPALPTYEQVVELPCEVEGFVVPDSFEDENGHMNIRNYFDLAARVISNVFSRVGITDDYRSSRGLGFFTAEHHLRYLSEIHVGESVSGYFRVLERSDKVVHAMVFLVNESERRLAYTLELIAPHVDLAARRTAPMPADIAQAWDHEIKTTADVVWEAPVCGSMGIRR
jgi:acyl-CoA thioester hydrolase